jgi:3-hydroxyisobutyrate dehydrogenase-like beta-hydroxyacid dehydrogenase
MSLEVGMIGLGIMGSAISANLLKEGISVVGYDVVKAQIDLLVSKGGKGAASPRDVAEKTDIVITLLPSVTALDEVVWGDDGLLASNHKGLIVVESGTLPLEDKLRAHAALNKAGMVMLDCTLSGTGAQAALKDLVVYGSGDRNAFDKCVPVFKGFARSNYYLGEFGNGSKMKYVANLLVAIHNVAAAEAFVLGMKAGLDPELIYKVISDGAGTSRMFEVRGPMMVQGRYDKATMKMDVWQKDLNIISSYAKNINCPTPLLANCAQVYIAAMAQGRDKQDTGSVCAVMEGWANYKREK